MISVWYFENTFTLGMALGGAMIFVGTFLYAWNGSKKKIE
jgi:hypothetical protein